MTTVLVVEDDDDIRQLIVDVLEMEGYRVLTATDGQQGLGVLSALTPDLVISDLAMPVLSGFDLARALRANPAYQHVPFIALSGAAQPEALRGHLFTMFLAKPFQMGDLVSAITQCLGRA